MSVTGKYELAKSENFDEYMKALGVGFVMRKMANAATPVTEIAKNEDQWNIKTTTTFKTTEIKFKLGDEFDEETADGRICKSKIVMEGDNKMIHSQTCKGLTLTILREFTDSEMIMTMEGPEKTVCTRTYKKIDIDV